MQQSQAPPKSFFNSHREIVEGIAPFFIGIVIAYFLWGIQVSQTYYYYRTYRKKDCLWVKLAVATIFIIDALGSCTIAESSWRHLVDLWGDPEFLIRPAGFGVNLSSTVEGLAPAWVQCFYAQKIWVLYDGPTRYMLVSTIVVLALTQAVTGAGLSVFMFTAQLTANDIHRVKIWTILRVTTGAAADVLIVILMILKLKRMRTGFKPTDDIISKLIAIVLETGLAMAVIQVMFVSVYLGYIRVDYFLVTSFVLPKIYSNSMLAVLNSRMSESDDNVHYSIPNTTLDIHTIPESEPKLSNLTFAGDDRL